MATDPREDDEEGLRWGDEADPTHVAAPVDPESPDAEDEEPPGGSSAMLVVYGVFGGVFLLYIVGWIITVQRNLQTGGILQPTGNPVVDFMNSLGGYLAVVGPLVWFLCVLWLAPRRPLPRILWLLLGVVLLAPLPFALGTGT